MKTQIYGQQVIVGLFFFIMSLIVVAIMFTPVMIFINVGINATNSSLHGSLLQVMLNYIPVFVVFMLFIALFSINR